MESRAQASEAELTASRYIAQRETGPWSDEDAAAFQRWLEESALHRVVYYRLNAAWQEAGRLQALSVSGASSAAASPSAPSAPFSPSEPAATQTASARGSSLGKYAIAASLLLTALGAITWHWHNDARNTYTTAIGVVQAVPLPDGSRVTLNTDSRLRIQLGDRAREIELSRGEAFFEVAHDPGRPFIVTAGDRHVVAVGTRFSVRRDGDDVRVVVTEGAVRFETVNGPGASAATGTGSSGSGETGHLSAPAAGSEPANVLSAGTVAVAAAAGIAVQKRPLPEVEQALSWREGLLTFRDTPLADAVAEFNRYNTRKIVIRDAAVAGAKVGGIFGATQPLRFVRLIERGFPVQALVEEDRIVLTSRQ